MFTEIDGLKINYVCEGEGENVLLLHGWGSNIKLFDIMIKHLAPYYKVYAPDMPGFGESDEPKTAWCVDDYVDFVLAFCKKMGIEKTILLGHSFGGRVIIKLNARLSKSLEIPKIILTDSAGIMPKRSFASKVRTRCYKIGKSFLSTGLMKKIAPNALENLRKKNGSADYNAASPIMRQCLVKVVNEDLTHLLEKITAPTLLIWGENDDATPLSDGKKMEELIPDAGLVTLKNAGHYAFLEQWYTFSRVLDSFLNIQ